MCSGHKPRDRSRCSYSATTSRSSSLVIAVRSIGRFLEILGSFFGFGTSRLTASQLLISLLGVNSRFVTGNPPGILGVVQDGFPTCTPSSVVHNYQCVAHR